MTAKVRDRLAALRDAYGLTDTGIARAAHLRQQDVSRFFNGDMKYPPLDFLDAICRVVHRTLADILNHEASKPALPAWQIRVLAHLSALDPSERIAFETLLTRGPAAGGSGRRRGRRGDR